MWEWVPQVSSLRYVVGWSLAIWFRKLECEGHKFHLCKHPTFKFSIQYIFECSHRWHLWAPDLSFLIYNIRNHKLSIKENKEKNDSKRYWNFIVHMLLDVPLQHGVRGHKCHQCEHPTFKFSLRYVVGCSLAILIIKLECEGHTSVTCVNIQHLNFPFDIFLNVHTGDTCWHHTLVF